MKSFKAAFRSVYEKGLMKHGFQRLKGTQPYYVRCIGDEIVHVITYREEMFGDEFVVLFGVATVYRKKIAIDEPARDSHDWLNELSSICYKENYCSMYDSRACEEMIPFRFVYDVRDENDRMNTLMKSLELTEKYALPVLDKVTTLDACMEHFFKYDSSLLRILEVSDRYVSGWLGDSYNEGLLSTVIYGKDRFEEYKKIKKRIMEWFNDDELYCIKNGLCGLTMEQHEESVIKRREVYVKKLNMYWELATDPEWQEKIREELKQRKINNINLLREFGLEV